LTYEGENIVMLLQTARSLMKVAAECSCVTDNIGKMKENEGKMKNPITGYIFRKPTSSSQINENSTVSRVEEINYRVKGNYRNIVMGEGNMAIG